MRLYWQDRRMGQRLILVADDESEVEVGAVRKTPRGFDALAKTNTYDPGRAQKGFTTLEEAKAFVESFHPWDLFGGYLNMDVESEVHLLPTTTDEQTADEPVLDAPANTTKSVVEEMAQAATSAEPSSRRESDADQPVEVDRKPGRGWQFWKKT